MRARWLKPEFFRDRKMGKLGPVAALVFEALWCMSDDGGVSLCDAEIVKGEMFMFWPSLGLPEISEALERLATEKRIERYTVGDAEYASIVNFHKHQGKVHNPSQFRHPRPTQGVTALEDAKLRQGSYSTPKSSGSPPPPIYLDTHTPNSGVNGSAPKRARHEYSPDFNELRTLYPKRSGGDSKDDAHREYQARLKQGETHEQMKAGTLRYKAYCDATGKTGTEYVKQMRTFLGPSRHYLDLWEIPVRLNGQRSAHEEQRRGYV